MKKIWSILVVTILLLSFTQDTNAAWRGRGWGWRGGYGYGYRPYIAAVPGPYIARPYYAPGPGPVAPGRWIAPHWRRGPYGDQWVRGHYTRPR
jgi:hypothetical protein